MTRGISHRKKYALPVQREVHNHVYSFIFRYGRRTVLTMATSLSGVSGLIQSFSMNYWMFLTFEFVNATIVAGIYSAGFILGALITGQ